MATGPHAQNDPKPYNTVEFCRNNEIMNTVPSLTKNISPASNLSLGPAQFD